ncbi:MAG: DUF937 domain-containing protein, partial [Saprospiraceae bacterium]
DLMQIIQNQLSDSVMNQLSNQIGGDKEQTSAATQGVLNTLIGAMAKNASSQEGASSLFNALNKDHDGSLLDSITDFMNPEAPNPVDEKATNGMGILQHLLGDKMGMISQLIGQQNGISQEGALGLMAKLAPIIMATLGKQQQSTDGFQISDLMGLLTNQKENIQKQPEQKGFLDMLDFDGDGSGVDDAMGLLSKFFGK